jgi:SAM-dependent methyltransferase
VKIKQKLREQARAFLRSNSSLRMALDEVRPLPEMRNLARTFGAWRFERGSMTSGSLGYASYKERSIDRSIRSPHIQRCFRDGSLPKGYGFRMDERIVEYPWAFSMLADQAHLILDAGSTFNYKYLLDSPQLRNKSITIMTLDFEGFVARPKPASYVYGDLRDTPFRDNYFDTVACLSTLEHVGMDNSVYTDDPSKIENDADAYIDAVLEMVRITKPGGKVLLTMPYGQARNWGWFQVFDQRMVNSIIHYLPDCRVSETYFKYSNDQWQFATKSDCSDCSCYVPGLSSFRPSDGLAFSRGVVCLCIEK